MGVGVGVGAGVGVGVEIGLGVGVGIGAGVGVGVASIVGIGDGAEVGKGDPSAGVGDGFTSGADSGLELPLHATSNVVNTQNASRNTFVMRIPVTACL